MAVIPHSEKMAALNYDTWFGKLASVCYRNVYVPQPLADAVLQKPFCQQIEIRGVVIPIIGRRTPMSREEMDFALHSPHRGWREIGLGFLMTYLKEGSNADCYCMSKVPYVRCHALEDVPNVIDSLLHVNRAKQVLAVVQGGMENTLSGRFQSRFAADGSLATRVELTFGQELALFADGGIIASDEAINAYSTGRLARKL